METVIVIAIVAVVFGIGGYSFYRTLTGKTTGCGCCKTCPSKVKEKAS